MSKQDVRKEQIALLRFENLLVEMADALSAGAAVATSTDSKLRSNAGSEHYENMKKALINLAETTSKAHDSLMNITVSSNARMIDVEALSARKINENTEIKHIDQHVGKPRVADAVKGKLVDQHVGKPRVADAVKGKLVDQHVGKPRVADAVKGKLVDQHVGKPRVGEVVKSKLSTS